MDITTNYIHEPKEDTLDNLDCFLNDDEKWLQRGNHFAVLDDSANDGYRHLLISEVNVAKRGEKVHFKYIHAVSRDKISIEVGNPYSRLLLCGSISSSCTKITGVGSCGSSPTGSNRGPVKHNKNGLIEEQEIMIEKVKGKAKVISGNLTYLRKIEKFPWLLIHGHKNSMAYTTEQKSGAVKEAKSLKGSTNYDSVTKNCEHFINHCLTGRSTSYQLP